MNNKIRSAVIIILSIVAIVILFRILFIKTVNYTIAGISIPARYNVLTGKAVPIANYKGKKPKNTVTDIKSDRLGLDTNDITAARFRWELFEEWVKGKPQYKDWASNAEVFNKANEEFKIMVRPSVKVIK